MQIPFGDLIAAITQVFEREFGDHELAILATQMITSEVLRRPTARRPRRLLTGDPLALSSAC